MLFLWLCCLADRKLSRTCRLGWEVSLPSLSPPAPLMSRGLALSHAFRQIKGLTLSITCTQMAIRALKWPWMRFMSSAFLPKPLLGAGASRKSSGCLAALTPSRQASSSNGLSADTPASGPSETTKCLKHKTPRKRYAGLLFVKNIS